MSKRNLKQICCCLLAAALLAACAGPGGGSPAAAQPALAENLAGAAGAAAPAPVSAAKEEVVYARLAASGEVQNIYVVNQFELTAPESLTDYGDYTAVTNLTSTAPLENANGAVRASAGPGLFYYQGDLATTDLPWRFALAYNLDGRPVTPGELAGQSGHLELRLRTEANPAVNPAFYDGYMLQITLTLDAEKCSDITSENGVMASAGKNRLITHTVLPGKAANILLSASVTDFSMPAIEIAGMPFSVSFDAPDTGGMVDEMAVLADAVAELNDGVRQLADGSGEFAAGQSELATNAATLIDGSAQIQAALRQVANGLEENSGELGKLGDLSKLPAALRQLAGGLSTLRTSYDTMLAALDAAITAIPAGTLGPADFAALYTALNVSAMASATDLASTTAALGQLAAVYEKAQVAKLTYITADPATGVSLQAGLAALSGGLGQMATGLEQMAKELEASLGGGDAAGMLGELVDGMGTLAKEYGAFHSGLAEYLGGVGKAAGGYLELDDGIADLYGGTSEMADELSGLPGAAQEEIDKLMDEYTGGDFSPVSFTSAKNTHTTQVQFVVMTQAIEPPAPPEAEAPPQAGESVWGRLTALFARNK